jgi:hypothetical protein
MKYIVYVFMTEREPYMKKKVIVTHVIFGHTPQKGHDTKTN